MRRGKLELRVRYADTDCAGVVYHANYFNYFEVARTELLRSLGLPYRALEESGIRLTVVGADARFLIPAVYDDLLRVETEIVEVAGARIRFRYEVLRGADGVLLCEGATTLACIQGPTGRPRRLPPELVERIS